MNNLIKTIENFTSDDEKIPNVLVTVLNHNTDDQAVLIEEKKDEVFFPFADEVKSFGGFTPMMLSEDTLFFAGTELFARLNENDNIQLVIFFDEEIKGFMPIPVEQIAEFVRSVEEQNGDAMSVNKPSRQEENDFARLKTAETELVTNDALVKFLDADDITEENLNQLMADAKFLLPIKVGKKNLKKGMYDYFLLNTPDNPELYFIPAFTDWQRLGNWYFSQAGVAFKNAKDTEIILVPSELLSDVQTSLNEKHKTAFVINPITNDFILSIDSNDTDQEN
ncbi:MAG: SseB family protein [Lactobacillaceae bacterium]|jgi:hypothetical protein|nr:SseB family protein [Lactobacillaceae bacterium]